MSAAKRTKPEQLSKKLADPLQKADALPATTSDSTGKSKAYTDEERAALEAKLPKPCQKLEVPYKEGLDYLRVVAEEVHNPTTKAALASNRMARREMGELDLMATVRLLRTQVAEVQSGDMRQADAMLVSQAYTLDAIMSECLRMFSANMADYPVAAREYLQLAFKAQSQTRMTWESLSKIKNPASPTFVRQANFANGPQQVNNGPDNSGPEKQSADINRAGERGNLPNELIGEAVRGSVDT